MSDEEEADVRRQLNEACINLLVTIGLVASVMDRFPPEVQGNFTEKINDFREQVHIVTNEFIDFGTAYDEQLDR